MRSAALVVLGRDDPYFVGKLCGYRFQDGEARCIDAIVVGEQHAWYFESSGWAQAVSPLSCMSSKRRLRYARSLSVKNSATGGDKNMLINCVAYQDGRKLGDISVEQIS